jgi:hypothetical protein
MAMTHAIGPIGGSFKQPSLSVTVWDDAFATLDPDEVVEYAATVIPNSIFGKLPTVDPGIDELAGHIYRVSFDYTPPELEPPDPPPVREQGTLARRMNFQAKSKTIYTCLEPIGVYSADGNVTDQYQFTKWRVNVNSEGVGQLRTLGLTIDPLPETRTLDYYAPNTFISDTYLDTLETLCGKFCSGTFFGRPQGSVQLVRASLYERTPDDWEISLGLGYKAAETNVDVSDEITIPEIRGSWIYWTRDRESPFDAGGDTGVIIDMKPEIAVVQRVWEEADLSGLNLPPTVSYPE